jgi:hypothetical protein
MSRLACFGAPRNPPTWRFKKGLECVAFSSSIPADVFGVVDFGSFTMENTDEDCAIR